MPLVAQPSGNSEGEQTTANGNQQGSDGKPKAITAPIKQAVGPNEAAIAQPQARTEQPDPYQLRDLKAQEDMAYWAKCMFVAAVLTFVVTSIGTFLIWRQVKLTRKAVEDTGKATEAMTRANELVAEGQRPWIDITMKVDRVIVDENGGLSLEFSISFTNIGKTIAHSVWTHVKNVNYASVDEARSGLDAVRSHWLLPKGASQQKLMPGEGTPHWGYSSWATFYWRGREIKKTEIVFLATALYRLNDDFSPLRETTRAFKIAMRGATVMDELSIQFPLKVDASAEDIIIRKAVPNYTS